MNVQHRPTRTWRVSAAVVVAATSVALLQAPGTSVAATARPHAELHVAQPIAAMSHQLVAVTAGQRLLVRGPVIGEVGWPDVGHAYNVTGVAYYGALLWATTTDNRLWVRPPITADMPWSPVGSTDHPVTALTVLNGQLLVVTTDNRLQTRSPWSSGGTPWDDIGPGPGSRITAVTSIGGEVWATTTSNRLVVRSSDGTWKDVGHANNVTALATLDGQLWATTSDNRLWYRSHATTNVDWTNVGSANNVTELTAVP